MLIHQTIYTVYLEIHYNVYVRYFSLNGKNSSRKEKKTATHKHNMDKFLLWKKKKNPAKNFQGEIKHFFFFYLQFSGILYTSFFFKLYICTLIVYII